MNFIHFECSITTVNPHQVYVCLHLSSSFLTSLFPSQLPWQIFSYISPIRVISLKRLHSPFHKFCRSSLVAMHLLWVCYTANPWFPYDMSSILENHSDIIFLTTAQCTSALLKFSSTLCLPLYRDFATQIIAFCELLVLGYSKGPRNIFSPISSVQLAFAFEPTK